MAAMPRAHLQDSSPSPGGSCDGLLLRGGEVGVEGATRKAGSGLAITLSCTSPGSPLLFPLIGENSGRGLLGCRRPGSLLSPVAATASPFLTASLGGSLT